MIGIVPIDFIVDQGLLDILNKRKLLKKISPKLYDICIVSWVLTGFLDMIEYNIGCG